MPRSIAVDGVVLVVLMLVDWIVLLVSGSHIALLVLLVLLVVVALLRLAYASPWRYSPPRAYESWW